MKKTLSMILAISLCLSLSLLFTACGHKHSFSTDWSKDATHHWHACTGEDCTEVADKAEHAYGENDTCACGAVKPVVTTVADAAAWAAAFEIGTNWTMHGVATQTSQKDDVTQTQDILAERNGNKLKETSTEGERVLVNYEAVEDNKCYYYSASYSDNEFIGYNKRDADGPTVEQFLSGWNTRYLMPQLFGNMESFTYNEQTKKYEVESLLNGNAKNVWVSFEDGKVAAVGYDMVMSTQSATVVITVTLGNVGEITLPTNIVTQ